MFRYQPPKSSVWGHLLKKVPTGRAKAMFEQFLARAVAEYKFTSASLSIDDASGQILSRYEHIVGIQAHLGRFGSLTLEQSDRCIAELTLDEAADAKSTGRFHLMQTFDITKWRVGPHEVPTRSLVSLHFGQLPCLATFLEFEAVEDFQCIQQVLADIGLCKLSEKNLKPVKSRKTK